jgi:putative transposase
VRGKLPHDVPLWVDPSQERYFVTVCCELRGKNQLARKDMVDNLFGTISHRNQESIWYTHLALVMPDHIHFIVSFPDNGKRIQTIISKWKEWTSKTLQIEWQRDFFEHRLRREESV